MKFNHKAHKVSFNVKDSGVAHIKRMLKEHTTIGAGLGSAGNHNEVVTSQLREYISNIPDHVNIFSITRNGSYGIIIDLLFNKRFELQNDYIERGRTLSYSVNLDTGKMTCISEDYFG